MIKKKLVAMIMSALVVAALPVHAEYSYTTLTVNNVTFNTVINGTNGASLPNITATYTVGAVSGPTGGASGTPSIASTTIAAGTSIETGNKYSATTTINMASVSFSKPGEYIWSITSTEITGTPGLTFSPATKYLHVFIEDDTENTANALKQGAVYISSSGVANDNSGKTTAFEGTYETQTLTINPSVAGNMGNKTEPMKYTLELSGCNPGTTIADVQVGNDNKATIEFTNKTHGDIISVSGIPIGAGYRITQDEIPGYTTSISVTK